MQFGQDSFLSLGQVGSQAGARSDYMQARKEEAQRGNEAVRRSNERIQELRRQLDGGGDRHAHITY